jgi:Retroviral aspartyl protease
MQLNKLYISYKKALNIPILFSSHHETVAARALVDSGATENFLDYRTAIRWRVQTHQLAKPREVFNVDGTQNKAGIITESCVLRIEKDQRSTEQHFFIMNLGADRVLLGYPWLYEFNPQIDWTKATVGGGQVHLKEQGVRWHEWRQQ